MNLELEITYISLKLKGTKSIAQGMLKNTASEHEKTKI